MKAIKYKPIKNTAPDAVDTPYSQANQEYDYMLAAARGQAKNWRIIAFALTGLLLLAVGGLIIMKSLRETKVLYVDVAAWGEARYIGDIAERKTGLNEISAVSKDFYLEKFLRNIRQLSTDPQVVENCIDDAYNYVTSQGATLLTDMLKKEESLVNKFGHYRIEVSTIESITKVLQDTYQIDWIETSVHLMSGKAITVRYRGMFLLYFDSHKVPSPENPLNFFIDEFEIDEIGEIR